MKNKKEKILIICRDFIPYVESIGSAVRMVTFAEFLHKNNFEVHILHAESFDVGYHGYEDQVKNYYRYTVVDAIRKKKLTQKYSNKNIQIQATKDGLKSKLRFWARRAIVPDDGVFLVNRMKGKAESIIVDQKITNVFVSSPCHSIQLVGLSLKRKFKEEINWLVDYRDSWNLSKINEGNNFISRSISTYLEKKVLRSCDHFLYVSPPYYEKIKKVFALNFDEKATLVRNGYITESSIQKSSQKDNSKLQIGYFGAISDSKNSFRNITNLFLAIEKYPEIKNKVDFHFYGQSDLFNISLSHYPNITIHGTVSQPECQNIMIDMDYLMLIHTDPASSDEVIPGKFYEYLAAKIPILCLSPENMEARKMIDKLEIGHHLDIANVDSMGKELLTLSRMKGCYEGLDISEYKRENQYEKILPLLKTTL